VSGPLSAQAILSRADCPDLRVEVARVAGSTNDDVLRRASHGEPEGLVMVADAQTSGKGRLGRTWHSPPGLNVHMSLLLRPRVAPETLPRLALVAGVAAARALEHEGLLPDLKWPNDVLIRSRKIAGILCESEQDAVVVGIGINVNQEVFPPEISGIATSLALETAEIRDRNAVAAGFLREFREGYLVFAGQGGELGRLREAWLHYWRVDDRRVTVRCGSESVAGTAVGIDDNGAFVLRLPGGESRSLLSGELEVME
jgi:BirA family biotin operon repressor/biotin-[acetyl-CoA-carboxylase] ligase